MIDYFSWLAMCFTISQFYFLSETRYKLGWSMGIVSAIAWGIYASITMQWAVLGLQFFLGSMSARALRKKAWLEESSGLPRRDVIDSKNQKKKTALRNAHTGGDHGSLDGISLDHDYL